MRCPSSQTTNLYWFEQVTELQMEELSTQQQPKVPIYIVSTPAGQKPIAPDCRNN